MDGGDMDGDEFVGIWNGAILAAFPRCSLPAWNEAERQLLLPGSCSRPTQRTPAAEQARREAAAWHMVRTCHGQGAKGRFSNQWLLVAETYGGNSTQARKMAYSYAMALDAAKMGGGAHKVPADCELTALPSHLQSHFAKYPADRFTERVDTALARLHAFDVDLSLPECALPDDCFHLAHPHYKPGSRHFETVMTPFLDTWERRYAEHKKELKERLPKDSGWDDPEKVRILNGVYEKYREMLLADYGNDEYQL